MIEFVGVPVEMSDLDDTEVADTDTVGEAVSEALTLGLGERVETMLADECEVLDSETVPLGEVALVAVTLDDVETNADKDCATLEETVKEADTDAELKADADGSVDGDTELDCCPDTENIKDSEAVVLAERLALSDEVSTAVEDCVI